MFEASDMIRMCGGGEVQILGVDRISESPHIFSIFLIRPGSGPGLPARYQECLFHNYVSFLCFIRPRGGMSAE